MQIVVILADACMHGGIIQPSFLKNDYLGFLLQLPQSLDFCMLQRFLYFNNGAEIFHLNTDNLTLCLLHPFSLISNDNCYSA